MSGRDTKNLNLRDLLFPSMPGWYVSIDWPIRVVAAAVMIFFACEAHYASKFWTDAAPMPFITSHLQAYLERDGATVFPVCLMAAIAILLPGVYVRAGATALVALFVVSGGAHAAYGYTVPRDPYAGLAVVGAPAGMTLADSPDELWPLEAFEPDGDLVAGRRFERGVDEVMRQAVTNMKTVIAQDGPKAMVMFHEAQAGRIPTMEQVRAEYPVMAGSQDVVVERAATRAPASATSQPKIH